MTNGDMILDLMKRQEVLDRAFLEATHKRDKYTHRNIKLALFDELGEVNHEYKAVWCWWKNSQKPVNEAKLLEELVDAWHFLNSLMNSHGNKAYLRDNIDQYVVDLEFSKEKKPDYFSSLFGLVQWLRKDTKANSTQVYYMIDITYSLGFTIQDVYNAYIEKDRENYDRIKRGY